MVFEDSPQILHQKQQEYTLYMALIHILDAMMPPGAYIYYIDSGLLCGGDVAEYLSSQGRKFVIMTSKTKPVKLWDFLSEDLSLYQW